MGSRNIKGRKSEGFPPLYISWPHFSFGKVRRERDDKITSFKSQVASFKTLRPANPSIRWTRCREKKILRIFSGNNELLYRMSNLIFNNFLLQYPGSLDSIKSGDARRHRRFLFRSCLANPSTVSSACLDSRDTVLGGMTKCGRFS